MQNQQIKADQQMKNFSIDEENITLTAREILEKRINITAEKYPLSLKTTHLAQLMNCDREQVYVSLRKKEIPGAKKIKGLGWRVPRDVFLAWYYGKEVQR